MLRLQTFGGLALTSGGAEKPQPRRRLALLSRIAACGDAGTTRDELLVLLWAERPAESARHSLDQLLYEMRRALGESTIVGSDRLRLDSNVLTSDVADFAAALEREDHAEAVDLYAGPFLQGFFLHDAPEFERWAEGARERHAADYRHALERLARSAEATGRHDDAVRWWRQLAAEDRLDSRAILGLMHALADAGDRAGALEQARLHERIVRAELDLGVEPAISAFAAELRARNSPSDAFVRSPPVPAPVRPAVEVPSIAAATATTRPAERATFPAGVRGRTALLSAAVALVLVAALSVAVGRHRDGVAAAAPHTHLTTNVAAYDLYLHGRDQTLMRSDSGVRLAIDYFTRATALDTTFAAAYAALAEMYATATYGSRLSPVERRVMFARASTAAQRALALDDSLAAAHVAAGIVRLIGYDVRGGAAEIRRGIAMDPSSSDARAYLAKVYEWTEQPAEALAEAQRGLLTEPLSPGANAELGRAFYFARRYDDALAQLRHVANLRPPLRRTAEYLAEIYLVNGQWADAIAVLHPASTELSRSSALMGYALARSGAATQARAILDELRAGIPSGAGSAFGVAEVYAGLGDYDQAFAWLDQSFDDYSLWPAIMGPLFDEWRADPRFERVRRRLALPAPRS